MIGTFGYNLYCLHFLLTQSSSIIELFLLLQSQLILPVDYLAADAEGYQVVSPLSGRLNIIGSKVLYGILLHDLYAETVLLEAPLALLVLLPRLLKYPATQHPCGVQRTDLPQAFHLLLELSLLFRDYEWRVKSFWLICRVVVGVLYEYRLRWAVQSFILNGQQGI